VPPVDVGATQLNATCVEVEEEIASVVGAEGTSSAVAVPLEVPAVPAAAALLATTETLYAPPGVNPVIVHVSALVVVQVPVVSPLAVAVAV
jgi:hypothetical protein